MWQSSAQLTRVEVGLQPAPATSLVAVPPLVLCGLKGFGVCCQGRALNMLLGPSMSSRQVQAACSAVSKPFLHRVCAPLYTPCAQGGDVVVWRATYFPTSSWFRSLCDRDQVGGGLFDSWGLPGKGHKLPCWGWKYCFQLVAGVRCPCVASCGAHACCPSGRAAHCQMSTMSESSIQQ